MAGFIPIEEDLTLSWGADFIHDFEIAAADDPIPAGTTARIVVRRGTTTLATWVGAVEARRVRMRVESTTIEAATIPASGGAGGTIWQLLVTLPDGADWCWRRGRVRWAPA